MPAVTKQRVRYCNNDSLVLSSSIRFSTVDFGPEWASGSHNTITSPLPTLQVASRQRFLVISYEAADMYRFATNVTVQYRMVDSPTCLIYWLVQSITDVYRISFVRSRIAIPMV